MRALLGLLREYHIDSYYHSHRVAAYVNYFAAQSRVSDEERVKLVCAALLHDIGKLCTPLEILDSPGKPTLEEYEEIKRHPQNGMYLLSDVLVEWLGEHSSGILCHHERWDGTGYPQELTGEKIALAGQIIAAGDVIDVITSKRPYKVALPYDDAINALRKYAGTQFSPKVAYSFLKLDCINPDLEDLHDSLKSCMAWKPNNQPISQAGRSHTQLAGDMRVAS